MEHYRVYGFTAEGRLADHDELLVPDDAQAIKASHGLFPLAARVELWHRARLVMIFRCPPRFRDGSLSRLYPCGLRNSARYADGTCRKDGRCPTQKQLGFGSCCRDARAMAGEVKA
jgi:hypothetical protein